MTSPAIQVAFNLLVALLLGAYLRHSVTSRAAVGLWWDFLRDEEPLRYWLQLTFVGLAIFECLWTVSKILGWI